jgi:hypothetical protein
MKKDTRTQAQDLILLAHKFQDTLSSPSVTIDQILISLSEAGLTLSIVDEDDTTSMFALQLLRYPTLKQYDSSIEVYV